MEYTIYNESLVSYVIRNTNSTGYVLSIVEENDTVTKNETFSLDKALVFDYRADAKAAVAILNKELCDGEKVFKIRKRKVVDLGEIEHDNWFREN